MLPPSSVRGGGDMAERFSASVASRHMACRASANLELAIPNWAPPEVDPDADNAANRGTQMHEMFAGVMGLPLKDQKNFAAALKYVADLRSTRRFKVLIEEKVTAHWLVSKPSTTVDLVLYVQDEIHVLDLKTGKIPVDPVGNEQLMYYALSFGHLAPKAKGVTLHIVQPWAGVMESWFASTSDLMRFMAQARTAETAILAGDTTFGPSDACKFCAANPHGRGAKGRPFCPALMEMYYPTIVDEAAILEKED